MYKKVDVPLHPETDAQCKGNNLNNKGYEEKCECSSN